MLSQPSFEEWLENNYINGNEDGGVVITKDNVESMFERYLEGLDVQELLDLGDEYGREMWKVGRDEMLKELRTN